MGYVATIGFFDGVHIGHRYLIDQVKAVAQTQGLQSAVLTFDEHPQTVLNGVAQPLLSTFQERTQLLKQTGIDEIFSFHFDVIQQLTAEEFMRILHAQCGVQVLLMGYDHQFGSDQMTDFADYAAVAQRVGLQLQAITVAPQGEVSSSKIRRALRVGDIPRANEMLGYAYSLTGEVVHGKGIGHQLGFPTANIHVAEDKLLPANGVYEVQVDGLDRTLKALLNIGTNPTIGNSQVSVELHIPHFEGNLYAQTLTVRLVRLIREERKFANLEELQQQIANDIDSIQHLGVD